jgi:hypothetical protein
VKFPKNRANLYLVVRTVFNYEDTTMVVIGGFSEWEDADNFKDECRQEWFDKTGSLVGVDFGVEMTTFYG